ncbi:MAG TPA: hypothetical protein VKT77_13660 [Chthonomonadaceae bacterium]|nr:hypothetical protein [Chthonomonadaceae bacterium]
MLSEPEQILQVVINVFDQLAIEYLVGGSVASGVYGVYRFTNDIDMVASITEAKVPALVAALNAFYADNEMIADAVDTNSSFSILHLDLMIKVDVFLKANDDWADEVWKRRQLLPVSADGALRAFLPSAEDAILQKLRWFQMGGGVSDRQWGDVLGMLRVQGAGSLDAGYLRFWAARIGVSGLLDRALANAAIA